jgi:hypothetical protein
VPSGDGPNAPLVIGCAVLGSLLLAGGLAGTWLHVRVIPVTASPPPALVASPSSGPSLPAPPVQPPLPAPVPASAPYVRGALDREVVRAGVQRHLGEVRTCYERALLTDPALTARVELSMVIDATGAVGSATADGTPRTDLSDCIATRARTWTFPVPMGGATVTVHYPFVLTPS